ncbi:hypothetical protein KPL37_00985 [Clostridium frigoris]|uniref:Uncharacterized protein n=1 Tax=Clostridium frigoris TaxID=205327 RepID=A0ABS6BN53_9CLOT|nr:hypothetical protein [Clostridium frigoris]MBU3158348.1 hypothetical protein [Clostridium frigoris]
MGMIVGIVGADLPAAFIKLLNIIYVLVNTIAIITNFIITFTPFRNKIINKFF